MAMQEKENGIALLLKRGELTGEIREKLVRKVEGLGIPRYLVAQHLGVSNSTLHKWEHGPTGRCSVSARRRLAMLLNGEMDHHLMGMVAERTVRYDDEELPDDMMMCMEKINQVYDICANSPTLGHRFLERMRNAATTVFLDLVASESSEPSQDGETQG